MLTHLVGACDPCTRESCWTNVIIPLPVSNDCHCAAVYMYTVMSPFIKKGNISKSQCHMFGNIASHL